MVGTPTGLGTGRNNANGLAFQHRERQISKVQHDVVRVVLMPHIGHAHIATHRGRDGFFSRFGAVKLGVRVGCRPRGQGRTKPGAVEASLASAERRGIGSGEFGMGHLLRANTRFFQLGRA